MDRPIESGDLYASGAEIAAVGDGGFSRRVFFQKFATGAGALWFSAMVPELALAHEHVQEKAAAGKLDVWEFLTAEQAKEVDALASQIIPTDDTPGAHEAHVVNFIDHVLAKYEVEMRPDFLRALQAFNDEARKQVTGAQSFAALNNEQQMAVMRTLEKTDAFQLMKAMTVLGFFSDPRHGGNKDQIGWKLLGLDNAGMYQPPFGYYDAELLTIKKEGE